MAQATFIQQGEQIDYTPGADVAAVQATIGRTEFELEDSTGLVQRFETRDDLIQSADCCQIKRETLPLSAREPRPMRLTCRSLPSLWSPMCFVPPFPLSR